MNDEIPPHLRPVRDLLMHAAHGSEPEDFPEAPDDLLDDLEEKLRGRAPVRPTGVDAVPWHQRLLRLFGTPAFGVVAALVVILFVAVPLMQGPSGFRDADDATDDVPAESVRIVLLGADPTAAAAIAEGGLIDPALRVETSDPSQAEATPDPKLILDFPAGRLRIFDAAGSELESVPLPSEPGDLPAAVARALGRLSDPESP